VSDVQKSCQTCNCASVAVTSDWATLKWPQWRPWCKGFKFCGCLWARKIADKRYDGRVADRLCLVSCVWKSVSHAVLTSGSVTKMNRCCLPPPVAVRDYIDRGCSAVKLGHWCERTRQCTCEQVTLRSQTTQTHTGNCDVKRRCQRKAVADIFRGVPSWPSRSRVGQSHALHIMKRTVA